MIDETDRRSKVSGSLRPLLMPRPISLTSVHEVPPCSPDKVSPIASRGLTEPSTHLELPGFQMQQSASFVSLLTANQLPETVKPHPVPRCDSNPPALNQSADLSEGSSKHDDARVVHLRELECLLNRLFKNERVTVADLDLNYAELHILVEVLMRKNRKFNFKWANQTPQHGIPQGDLRAGAGVSRGGISQALRGEHQVRLQAHF